MAVKYVIDRLEEVSAPLREHYVKGEGDKFYLATQGDHPKVAEFREKNVALMKKFEGIDPEIVAADRVKLAELEKAKPNERIAALEAELTTEKGIRAAARGSKLNAHLCTRPCAGKRCRRCLRRGGFGCPPKL